MSDILTPQGKHFNNSTGRRRRERAFLRRWAGRLLLITTIFGGNMGRLAAEPSKDRTKEAGTQSQDELSSVRSELNDFNEAVANFNRFIANMPEGIPRQIGRSAFSLSVIQELISSVEALSSEMDNIDTLDADQGDLNRFRAFNRWLNGFLTGESRGDDSPITESDVQALESEITSRFRHLETRAAQEQGLQNAAEALVQLARDRENAQPEDEEPTEDEEPSVAGVVPQPTSDQTAEVEEEQEITEGGQEREQNINGSQEGERMRMRQLASQGVQIAESILGSQRVRGYLNGLDDCPSEMMNALGNEEGILNDLPVIENQSSANSIEALILNRITALYNSLSVEEPNWETVANSYLALSRDCDTIGMMINMWNAMNFESIGDPEAQTEVREDVKQDFLDAVNTLGQQPDTNPFSRYDRVELLAIAEGYGLSSSITNEDRLGRALRERINRLEDQENIPTALEDLRGLMQTVLDGDYQEDDVIEYGNSLIMQYDLLRSEECRRQEMLYSLYLDLIPVEVENGGGQSSSLSNESSIYAQGLTPDRTESTIRSLSNVESSLFTIMRMYSPLNYLSMDNLHPDRIYSSLFGGDITITIDGETTNLFHTPGAVGYLENAIRVAEEGVDGDNRALQIAQDYLEQLRGYENGLGAGELTDEQLSRIGSLTESAYRCAIGLLYIRDAQIRLDNNGDLFGVSNENEEQARQALDSAILHYEASFSDMDDSSSYYPNLPASRATRAINLLSPPSNEDFGSIMMRRAGDVLSIPYSMRQDAIFLMSLGGEADPDRVARVSSLAGMDDPFSGTHEQRRLIQAHLRFQHLNPDFSTSPSREGVGAFRHADNLIDLRNKRISRVPVEVRMNNPWSVPVDTCRDEYNQAHYRDQSILSTGVDDAGFVPQEIERQRRLHRDSSAPPILNSDLSTDEGANAVGLDDPLNEYEALDIDHLDSRLRALAESYGNIDQGNLSPYSEMVRLGNGVLLDVLETRINQLQMLLNRTEEPGDEDLRHYQYANRSLEEARELLATMEDHQRESLFDLDSASANPLEAIAIAENGLVAISQVDGFGTHNPTPEGLRLQNFFAGTPRAQIIWNEPDTYRISMRVGVITEDGGSMSIEDYDEQREAAGLPRVIRNVHFLLYERTTDPNRYRLRNPRYTGPEGDVPEYVGIADVNEGVVYQAERVMDPERGELWIPLADGDGENQVLFRINRDLTPIIDQQYMENLDRERRVFFGGGSYGNRVIPRWGPPPIPVGYIASDIQER